MAIKDYFTTAASNDTAGALWQEGMARSDVNNSARQGQADLRNWYNDAQWIEYLDGEGDGSVSFDSATTFTVDGADVTDVYHVGRRVKASGSLTGTIYGTITASAFSTDTTVTVDWDSGSLSNEAIRIWIGATSHDNPSVPRGINLGEWAWGGTSGGSADAQTLTIPGLTALEAGMRVRFIAGFDNTVTHPTLEVNSLGAKTLKTRGNGAIRPGWIVAGLLYEVVYDGTRFLVQSSFVRRVSFASSGTWTKEDGLISATARVVGGGGGGGGADQTIGEQGAGGGGGGGGISEKTIVAADLGASETVTVGSLGSGGATGNSDGSAGGTSSFGAHCSATGGSGGTGGASTSGNLSRPGGAAGVGSGGDINAAGGDGENGHVASGHAMAGSGGGSVYANRTRAPAADAAGNAASSFGGGGSGGRAATADHSGGAGAAGRVDVWERY